jgi:hypothetical protein
MRSTAWMVARIRQQHPEWSIHVVEPGVGWIGVRDGMRVWAPDVARLGAALTAIEEGRKPGASIHLKVDSD